MHCHQPTKDYVARRAVEGKIKTEILRCLKRYIARETYPCLLALASPRPPGASAAWPRKLRVVLARLADQDPFR